MEAGGARPGLDYRTINKVMCALEGGQGLFRRSINLDAQAHGQGLLKAKIHLLLKSYMPQSGIYDQIALRGYFPYNPFS